MTPSTKYISAVRLPLMGVEPRAEQVKKSLTRWYVLSDKLMRLLPPELTIREAKLTASPQISKANLREPTTPATTEPLCMPMRMSQPGWLFSLRIRTNCIISSEASTASTACEGDRLGIPETNI